MYWVMSVMALHTLDPGALHVLHDWAGKVCLVIEPVTFTWPAASLCNPNASILLTGFTQGVLPPKPWQGRYAWHRHQQT